MARYIRKHRNLFSFKNLADSKEEADHNDLAAQTVAILSDVIKLENIVLTTEYCRRL